jgi:nucleoid DNA-binding protein
MTKADITATIVARTGISTKKVRKALDMALDTLRVALKADRTVDLGRLGKLKTVKLSSRRRITKGLNNVVPSIYPYSRYAKTVKLKSKLDLSKDPLPTIVHPVPAEPEPVVFSKRPCAIAFPRWRRRESKTLIR